MMNIISTFRVDDMAYPSGRRTDDGAPPRSGLTDEDRAHNARVNDLGWSYDQRREAIQAIIDRYGWTGEKAKEIGGKSDSYLEARIAAIKEADLKDARVEGKLREKVVREQAREKRAAEKQARGDAESAEAAWRKSNANLNAWRDAPPLVAEANNPGGRRDGDDRADAASAQAAYQQSVDRLNGWRSDADGKGTAPGASVEVTLRKQPPPKPQQARGDAEAAEAARQAANARLNGWRD